jgi:hypothetical protein
VAMAIMVAVVVVAIMMVAEIDHHLALLGT